MKNFLYGLVVVIIILAASAWLFGRAETEDLALDEAEPVVETHSFEAENSEVNLQVVPTNLGSSTDETEDETPAEEEEDGEEVVISVADSGFEPNEITIQAGTTVTFVNNGQALHWPASDVHPTHEALPEFDADRGLQTGESYSYTFTEIGEWSFHDHLRPSFVGTITITE